MPDELTAAGIADPMLRDAYRHCRAVNARHGRTYYLATWLLPPQHRPAVHALYAFARTADDIIDEVDAIGTADDVDASRTADARAWRLDRLAADLRQSHPTHPIVAAVRDAIHRYAIDRAHFDDFLASMRMDLTVSDYADFADLEHYMHGSAAAIGLELLPVLGTVTGMRTVAEPYARDLGIAFQLTNFIRDVGEDLRRGRVYLPKDEMAAFGVTRDDLASNVVTGRIRRLLAFQIARARERYRDAAPGIRLLDPRSRDCVRTAFTLYGDILTAVELADYQVLDRRVAVGPWRRGVVALPGLIRAQRASRQGRRGA